MTPYTAEKWAECYREWWSIGVFVSKRQAIRAAKRQARSVMGGCSVRVLRGRKVVWERG